MPPPIELNDADMGVDILIRKKVKRGNHIQEKKTYAIAVPQPAVASATYSAVQQPVVPRIIMDSHHGGVQSDIDFTVPDIAHIKPTMTQQAYVRQFLLRKTVFIETLLARYSLPHDSKCSKCGIPAAFYRCRSCHRNELHCRGCMRNVHKANPFHKIEHWNGTFFQRAALWQIGLRLLAPNTDGTCHCLSYQSAIIEGQEIARDATRASRAHSFQKRKQPDGELINEADVEISNFLPPVPNFLDSDDFVDDVPSGSNSDPDTDFEIDDDDEVFDEDEIDGDRLGHGIPLSDSLGNRFVVIVDSSGIHHLPLVVCKCNLRTVDQQVNDCVSCGLMPASYKTIRTLFTEECLDDFRLVNLEAKTTPYQYYSYLRRRTNSSFPSSVPNRYPELRRMSREWRLMKREIWAGIHMPIPKSQPVSGTAPTGSANTAPTGSANNLDQISPDDSNNSPLLSTNTEGITPPPLSGIPTTNTEVEGISPPPLPGIPTTNTQGIISIPPVDAEPSLAIFCPACPQPGVNLPTNWKSHPNQEIYNRSFVMDGNFTADHLRQKGGTTDVWLLDGRGMFAERKKYAQHLAEAIETQTNAPCEHNFRAVGLGSMTRKDCDVTGIGASACARHGCFAPGGVVDFQKGERQMNMDWSICESIKNTNTPPNAKVFLLYDIWCQYCIYLEERAARNKYLNFPPGITFDGGIGLFHVHGHADQCFYRYASYFIPGAAIVDGEVLETLWSVLNKISHSTRSATLPHREEIMDDSMNDSNWKKWVTIVPRLVTKYKQAVEKTVDEQFYFDNLTLQAGPIYTSQWTKDIEDAEKNRTSVNAKSMDIMATQETRMKGRAEIHYSINEGNPGLSTDTGYIVDGLKLEEEQLQLGVTIAKMGPYPTRSEKQEATTLRKRLLTRIQNLHSLSAGVLGVEICSLFPDQRQPIPIFNSDIEEGIAVDPDVIPDMDEAQPALAYTTGAVEMHAELIFLMLPSGLPKEEYDKFTNVDSRHYNAGFAALCAIELQLRLGHANDILQDIRNSISRMSFQWTKNYRAADRKMPKTRSRAAIDNLHKSVSHCRRVYNLCRARLIALKISDTLLQGSYKAITNVDIRPSTAIRDGTERGTTRQKLSWIFQTEMQRRGEDNDEAYLREYLRIHWMRARALTNRWKEELELVKNEMLWTWICFKRKQLHWEGIGEVSSDNEFDGKCAYVMKQVFLWKKMADSANSSYKAVNGSFQPYL